jgi:hypothetical protein
MPGSEFALPNTGSGGFGYGEKVQDCTIQQWLLPQRHRGHRYESCLCRELSLRGLEFQRQLAVPIEYRGLQLDCVYRLDLIVEIDQSL